MVVNPKYIMIKVVSSMDWMELTRYLDRIGRPYALEDDGEEFIINIVGVGSYHARTLQEVFNWAKSAEPVNFLELAQKHADDNSGCLKVAVGSVIVGANNGVLSYGTNLAVPDLCRREGCLRILKFGNDYKTHRGPTDCRAIHSEVDAISKCAKHGIATNGATIYVSRYPCEACARQIVMAGIKHVVYGRQQEISDMTKEIFDAYNVSYEWDKTFDAEDTTR